MYSKRTTLWFLGILILLVLGFTFVITRPFLYPVATAIIVAVVFYPAHLRILTWTKGKAGESALYSTLILLFLFLVPVMIVLVMATNEGVAAAQYLTRRSAQEGGITLFLTTLAHRGLAVLEKWIDVSKFSVEDTVRSHVQQAGVWMLGSGAAVLRGFAGLIGNSLISLVVVFFLFRDGADWIHRTESIVPLSPGQARRLFTNISDTIVANVYGILSVGVAQGILTGIAVAIVGLQSPLLLGLGAAFASVVPVVGALELWVLFSLSHSCTLFSLLFTSLLNLLVSTSISIWRCPSAVGAVWILYQPRYQPMPTNARTRAASKASRFRMSSPPRTQNRPRQSVARRRGDTRRRSVGPEQTPGRAICPFFIVRFSFFIHGVAGDK